MSTEAGALPYEGVTSILVIADSANNRYIICDADKLVFLEQIGTGRAGSVNGSFKEAEFYHT